MAKGTILLRKKQCLSHGAVGCGAGIKIDDSTVVGHVCLPEAIVFAS